MTTATIDIDTLNDLFDNQKKLDDIFSSIFDEDPFLSSPMTVDEQSVEKSDQDSYSNDDFSFNVEDNYFVQEKRSIAYIIMPVVLEIAILYYGIMYLI